MIKKADIVMAGVGGQGLIKASDLLAVAAFNAGLDIKKAEVHGLAQRGGSLFIQLRIAKKVLSPLIDAGEADFLLGLEKLEAYRYCDYLSPKGTLIHDDLEIVPIGYKKSDYPQDLDTKLSEIEAVCVKVRAMDEARKVGNPRAQNVLMLSKINQYLKLPDEAWEKSFFSNFREPVAKANWEIFAKANL